MNEDQVMHSKSDNIEIMINDKADESHKRTFPITSFRILEKLMKHNLSLIVFSYYYMKTIK